IEVTFDIDSNGILNVNAKDKATGKEQSIRIEASSGLSDEEVNKMVNDSKKYESEDKKKREEIDLRNQSEQLIYQTEKNIKEFDEKLDDADKKSINDAVDKLKTANSGSNIDDIKSEMENLNNVWSGLATKMYDAAKTEEAPQPDDAEPKKPGKGKKGDEEIEDADFEVVD
ncbi:Hsp70 family protein, partial [Candidatus Neomarinimicrobiota bacterium]